ncbi:ABC transporter ATP-binding protein/permease [Spiroplasma sabaudiense Ar-1343]|uniref:ABC transporter ATP-binding protein/permease n=1 Tax=Spiroplasma sabaudiense Ar-1343 TaxID=1276257 RepID=W6A8Z3_9MOLU|nr:ABC transporter ATP-binding protein [Spiroplasma sabaudiense]AHI53618.1 ABC transporter ATP-binding protein/permease [Spiroplasma sabaudiense Ar-1343]
MEKKRKSFTDVNEYLETPEESKQSALALMKSIKDRRIGFFKLVTIFYGRYFWKSLAIIIALIISSVAIVSMTYIISQLVSQVMFEFGGTTSQSSDTGLNWYWWLTIAFITLIIAAIATWVREKFGGMLGRKIEMDARNAVLSNLINMNIGYYSDKKIGEIMTKLINDTQVLGDEAQLTPANLISIPIIFIGSAISLIIVDWPTAIVALVCTLIFMVIVIFTFNAQSNETERVRKKVTEVNGDSTDRIGAIALIKASGTEKYEQKRLKMINEDYYLSNRKLNSVQATTITIIIMSALSLTLIAITSAILIYRNAENGADQIIRILPSLITGINTLAWPIYTLTGLIPGMARATASTRRVVELIKVDSTLEINEFAPEVKSIEGNIIFKDVVFEYPEKPGIVILPKTQLVLEKGKSYAFVGETGSGKSTISKLLLRFYDPTSGEIIVNGQNLKSLNLSSYLSHVGYVEQEPKILYGDVMYNVRYGNFSATDEEVIEACKKANLHDLVQTWVNGYQTILGERGFIMSGGQKQRLVIARMILKDPQVLILDEATSALDNIVEKEIQKELEKIMVGKTTISIAHRLSTIKNSDQIFVLGSGQGIVQSGTYDELISKPGHFKKLHSAGS